MSLSDARNFKISMILIGAYISYFFAWKYFALDADVINSAIVWHEIKLNGISAINAWLPTDDNWYLSAYPIHFLLFFITGDSSPLILKILSAAQVFICAILASSIAYKITKKNIVYFLIPLLTCLSSFSYNVGFVAHIFSHNLTNMFGLLCIYLFISREKNSTVKCLIICILSFSAAISDPWYMVAYYLPLLLSEVYLSWSSKKIEKTKIAFYIIGLIIFLSHVVQKWLGVPYAKFNIVTPDLFFINLKWFILDSGRLLNFTFINTEYSYIITFAIITSSLVWGLIKKNSLDIYQFLFLMSILGVASSFIIGMPEKMEYSARFLVNIIYIIPILLVVINKKLINIFCIIFFTTWFASSLWFNTQSGANEYDKKTFGIIKFLEENNLHYGYGGYWGARANSVTLMSKHNVVIRPMMIDQNSGMINFDSYHAQSFTSWYKSKDNLSKTIPQFVVITKDPETCPQVSLCEIGLQKQFGVPDKKLQYEDLTFFIYNKELH